MMTTTFALVPTWRARLSRRSGPATPHPPRIAEVDFPALPFAGTAGTRTEALVLLWQEIRGSARCKSRRCRILASTSSPSRPVCSRLIRALCVVAGRHRVVSGSSASSPRDADTTPYYEYRSGFRPTSAAPRRLRPNAMLYWICVQGSSKSTIVACTRAFSMD